MKSEIERLAKELWEKVLAQEDGHTAQTQASRLARFASLLAEECAKECDEQAESHQDFKNTQAAVGCDGCADAIRAKFALSDLKDAAK